jgi:hypothetical protein
MKQVYVNGFGVVDKEEIEVNKFQNERVIKVLVQTLDKSEIEAYIVKMQDCFALKGFLSTTSDTYVPNTAVTLITNVGSTTIGEILNG